MYVSTLQPTEAVGDWRKNIEDKADRKKMFETSWTSVALSAVKHVWHHAAGLCLIELFCFLSAES